MKIFCILPKINIQFYLKLRTPILHRQFFRIISQNLDYIKNPFHFACRKEYLYNQNRFVNLKMVVKVKKLKRLDTLTIMTNPKNIFYADIIM